MIVGLFLRRIKAYQNINFIPIGFKHNLSSYIGENGVGKSSILEGFDSFFNNKDYPIYKPSSSGAESYFAPVFLIEKEGFLED